MQLVDEIFVHPISEVDITGLDVDILSETEPTDPVGFQTTSEQKV